jgi:threonine/homoserine/homoserine lactone efflux protein
MIDNLLFLWLAAIPLMGSPGPATMSLAGLGSAYGVRAALPFLGGIILGTFAVLTLIASGVTALLLTLPALVAALTAAAALYILWLAWKIATAPVGAGTLDGRPPPRFLGGLALAIANPKAFAAIGAVYAGHQVVKDSLLADSLVKVAALTLVIVVVNSAWLALGSSFSLFLTNPKTGRAANLIFAVLLVLSVALAVLAG